MLKSLLWLKILKGFRKIKLQQKGRKRKTQQSKREREKISICTLLKMYKHPSLKNVCQQPTMRHPQVKISTQQSIPIVTKKKKKTSIVSMNNKST